MVNTEKDIVDGYPVPSYQVYKDNTDLIYCSSMKFTNYEEGAEWIKACIKSHIGERCVGNPWISDKQEKGWIVWP